MIVGEIFDEIFDMFGSRLVKVCCLCGVLIGNLMVRIPNLTSYPKPPILRCMDVYVYAFICESWASQAIIKEA
jgi:hypothetical protein